MHPIDPPQASPTETRLAQRLRLHAEALADAQALRRAALADFWRGTDAVLADAMDRVRRSSVRFLHRLQRHDPQRHDPQRHPLPRHDLPRGARPVRAMELPRPTPAAVPQRPL